MNGSNYLPPAIIKASNHRLQMAIQALRINGNTPATMAEVYAARTDRRELRTQYRTAITRAEARMERAAMRQRLAAYLHGTNTRTA